LQKKKLLHKQQKHPKPNLCLSSTAGMGFLLEVEGTLVDLPCLRQLLGQTVLPT